ncbi:AAA family ATPase [Bacillaceae bacterium Marseille-Q3522]|nr:AAA family ATPase [Bacillaceae bacterium Marseille-Q3522]
MKKNNGDLQTEQQRVRLVIEEVEKNINHLMKKSKNIQADAAEIRKNFWNDVTVNLDELDDVIETHTSIRQQSELLSERERSKGHLDKQLKILDKLKNSPYFARIDFKEEEEQTAESIYLGIASLMDQKEEQFLIYDWRAPISSVYYDYVPGPAKYSTPSGEITGELEKKRQFLIKNGKMEAMFDTNVTIGDEMLQAVLGNNANTQMKSIVATIQKEQNQIIRNDHSKYLIVQGVAGSGKTSAALQRVAYLLYKYRETLSSDNIMLFSPNPLFNSYVSTVLPELGEENMQQTTFQEFISARIGRYFKLEDSFEQLEAMLTEKDEEKYNQRVSGIKFKGSLLFKEKIDEYATALQKTGMMFKDIIFRKQKIITKEEISSYFYHLDGSISIPNRIEHVQRWLKEELKLFAKKERKKKWVEDEMQFLEKEDYLRAYHMSQKKANDFISFEQEQIILAKWVVNDKLRPVLAKVKRYAFIDLKGMYRQLFENDTLFSLQDGKAIAAFTKEKLARNYLPYEDAAAFLYLQERIEGRKSSTSIRHVFIDEAQDYTPLQFALLKRIFPYSKMTLLGDMNQAIYIKADNVTDLFSLIETEERETIRLSKSYRSTRQIVDFTKDITKCGKEIEAFNRDGNKPTVTVTKDIKEHTEKIIALIDQLKQSNFKTIALITKTAAESRSAYKLLKQHLPLHLVQKGTNTFAEGVAVIPAYLAKGIEFDAVLIFNASQDVYRKEQERELFYTACTRAMHELHLLSFRSPLSKFISDSDLYELNE